MGRIIPVYCSDETGTSIDAIKHWKSAPGGIAGLMAFALAKLDSPVGFIGCVGNDETGLFLKNALEEQNINTQGVRVVADTQTGWIWSLRHPNGDTSFHSPQLSLEHFADGQLSTFDIDPVWFEKHTFFIPQAGMLGLERNREAIYYAKELTKRVQGITFFDANFRRYAWQNREEAVEITTNFAKTCEVVQISREDSKLFFNVASVKELSKLLPQSRGILLTKGVEGCEYLLDGNFNSIAGFSVDVVDTSLGGDAFLAAFISKVAQFGIDSIRDPDACEEFIRFANAAGACTVSKMRGPSAFPTVGEVEELMLTGDMTFDASEIPIAANS